MNYWTYATPEGDFSIVERHGRGADLISVKLSSAIIAIR
jgi:hypothetical protein